jgi:hypothetical protein
MVAIDALPLIIAKDEATTVPHSGSVGEREPADATEAVSGVEVRRDRL